MNKYRFTDENGNEWVRVNKTTAHKAYNNGLAVVFCPVNMKPFDPWGMGMKINIDDWDGAKTPFERALDEYAWYNFNAETGKYAAFYIMQQ